MNLRHGILAHTQFTDEEREFLKAVEEYQQKTGRKFLHFTEVLRIAVALGYRKVKDAEK